MNLTLITSLIASIAGFGLAWQLQAHQITKLKLEATNERVAIQRNARATLERNMSQIATAQAASTKRGVRILADVDLSRNAADGLRVTTDTTVRTAADDPSACNSIIAAYASILAEGSDFIREVAESADQCHSDIQMIQEVWPK